MTLSTSPRIRRDERKAMVNPIQRALILFAVFCFPRFLAKSMGGSRAPSRSRVCGVSKYERMLRIL